MVLVFTLVPSLLSHAQTEREREAASKGVAFLLSVQDANGGWCSEEYQMSSPGHKTALTCAVMHALIVSSKSPETLKAIERGLAFLSSTLKDLGQGAIHDGFKFSVWGPAYGLVHLHGLRARWPKGETPPDVTKLVEAYVQYAKEMQKPCGGWDYRADSPDGSVSFLSGVMIDGLLKWKDELKIDGAVIDRALRDLSLQVSDGWYAYSHDGKYGKGAPPPESVGRSVGIQVALALGGKAEPESLAHYVDEAFRVRGEYTKVRNEHGHMPPHFIAGYYYYHSLYYAARALTILGADPKNHVKTIRETLVAEQAAEGSWIDAPCGGRPYGTALCLLTLAETERLISPFCETLEAALAKAKNSGTPVLHFFADARPDSAEMERILLSPEFAETLKKFTCVRTEIRKDDPVCKSALVTSGPVILILNPAEAKPLAKPVRKYSGKRPSKILLEDLNKVSKEMQK